MRFKSKNQLIYLVIILSLSIIACTQETRTIQLNKNHSQKLPVIEQQAKVVVKQAKVVPKPCEKLPYKSRIEVDISEQKLYLFCTYKNGQPEEMKTYPVSTSKYGIGNRAGSGRTPLGRHYIKQKVGYNAPKGMIFKARRETGKIAKMNRRGAGDLVTTRIMWLKGKEQGKNLGSRIDSFKRYIYIHGTAEENKIGKPASHGCIRMYNHDVIDLFDKVKIGTNVFIKR
jgi:lipoprotein-anchoring transpeptidase ErfK/SrfK